MERGWLCTATPTSAEHMSLLTDDGLLSDMQAEVAAVEWLLCIASHATRLRPILQLRALSVAEHRVGACVLGVTSHDAIARGPASVPLRARLGCARARYGRGMRLVCERVKRGANDSAMSNWRAIKCPSLSSLACSACLPCACPSRSLLVSLRLEPTKDWVAWISTLKEVKPEAVLQQGSKAVVSAKRQRGRGGRATEPARWGQRGRWREAASQRPKQHFVPTHSPARLRVR